MKHIRILIFFMLLLVTAFLALAGRCFYLQYYRNEHYNSISVRQQEKLIPQQPQRGVILDCRGRVLAASNKVQTIFAEPRVIKDPEKIAVELAPILRMGSQEICELIKQSKNPGYVKIKVNADANQCRDVAKVPGVGVQSDWQRTYPMGPLVSHVVGFTSADNRGMDGIELQCNKELTGSPGQNIFFADASRRPIRFKEQTSVLNDGVGVILTIDATIQQFAREALMEQYKYFQAESAVAVVADPKTGAILAMVSLPDFDPNNFNSVDMDHLRNRAITDQYEPGSILKPFAAALAVEAGAVGKNEVIYCEDGFYHGKGFGQISEYSNHRYGMLAVREILIKSSNIGMAKIGQKLGSEKLYKGMRLFGFGRQTGIDLPGEVEGLLWPLNKWTGYSVTRIPFGQEITVTAIQLIRAFCMLSNGGHSVQPYIVQAMVDKDGEITKIKHPSPPIGFVIKPEVANWMITDPLVGVINEKDKGGTGWRAKLEKWQVFGKTGTANIAKTSQKGYSESDYIASFLAGAPVENPKIVVLVSIRKPNKARGEYTGGAVASPVAGKIIEKTLNYLETTQQ
jgi:cell division protein FtsI/penicillin-binding protein 2